MARYGFEIEFDNLYLQPTRNKKPFSEDKAPLQLQSKKGGPYIDIIPDASYGDKYVFEARSAPSEEKITVDYFSGLTSLISDLQKNKKTLFQAPYTYALNADWNILVNNDTTVHYDGEDPNKEQIVYTHTTFGFNEPSDLIKFYNNFKNVIEIKEDVFIDGMQPFSNEAENIFNKFFSMLDEKDFPLIEFLRFYVGQALRKRTADELRNGNKDYLSIMNRMSFRPTYQYLSPQSEKIIRYILDGYCLHIPNQPFPLLGVNDMIYGDPFDGAAPYPCVQKTYTNHVSCKNFLESIFAESSSKILNDMTLTPQAKSVLTKNLKGSSEDKRVYVQESLSYIKLADWLSPVPYSMQDDSMGLYPRYPDYYTGPLNTFILEVRAMGKKLKHDVFNEEYKTELAAQCSLATLNWTKN